jgi:hypothetical protein
MTEPAPDVVPDNVSLRSEDSRGYSDKAHTGRQHIAPLTPSTYYNEDDQSTWMIRPDWFKFWLSLVMYVMIVVTFAVLAVAMTGDGLFCPPTPNDAIVARIGTMYSYQNTSADKCLSFYDYSCGSFDARFPSSSLFQQTQNEIMAVLVADGVFTGSVDKTLPSTPDFNETGLFECVVVDVMADYTDPTTNAVYISTYCHDCPPQVHHLSPSRISGHTEVFPDDINAIVAQAIGMSKRVYWLTPESGATPQTWYESGCDRGTASAEYQWNGISARSTTSLMLTLYEQNVDGFFTDNALPNKDSVDLESLVEATRAEVLQYIAVASWLTSDESRAILTKRVQSLPIHIGGATLRDSGCTLAQSLYDCLRYMYSNAKNSLTTRVNPNATSVWPFGRFVVNAAYVPQVGAVYVPWGIAQKPFYDPLWLETEAPVMKPATLGAVIAHEIGHAIDNTAWNNINYSDADIVAIESVKRCIATRYTKAGSVRSDFTASENWADYIGVQSALRKIRLYPTPKIQTAFILWSQTTCSSGTARIGDVNSTDDHSSWYLRDTATLTMLEPWHSAFECPNVEEVYGRLCG